MESRENPLFGRKIFLINPSFIIEKFLIENLRRNEYEVYLIDDYKKAKAILANYPDSLCFINIDSELSYSEWFNYMKSFSLSKALSGIYLGVMSTSAGWDDKDKFLFNIRLPGGFNHVEKTEKFLKDFMMILDLNGAKGRRKYIRLDTRGIDDVNGYIVHQGKLFTLGIKDISSAGFAVTFKKELSYIFQKNTHIRDLSITVGRKSMVCSCIVFNTMINADGSAMSVLMLTNENPETTKDFIRNYIFEKFDGNMKEMFGQLSLDYASYSEPDEYSKIVAVRDRSSEELESLGELDEELTLDSPEALDAGGAEASSESNLDDDIL